MFLLTKWVHIKNEKILLGNTTCVADTYSFHIMMSGIFKRILNFAFIFFFSPVFLWLGLGSKQIYLKSGDSSNVAELLESFKKDARSVKLRAGKHQLEDVTDVLKSFLSQVDDALLTKELYPFWISALGNVFNNIQYNKVYMYIFSFKFERFVKLLTLCQLMLFHN